MSIETRLRETGPRGGGGGSSNSGGLASTGGAYVTYIADGTLSNERILTAGANITLTTDGTTITVAANTGGASNSAGLLGTGGFFILGSANSQMPNSSVIQPGSSVTFNYTGSNLFISAVTSLFAGTAGLAGTGPFYLTHTSANGTLPNSKRIAAGSSVTTHTDSTTFYINAITSLGSSIVYAPTGGNYVAFLADAALSNEKVLTAGSSVIIRTDAAAIYIDAQTGGGGTTVYAPTGGNYVTFIADAALTNERILVAGSNVTVTTSATQIIIAATTGGGSGNPDGYYPLLPQQAKLLTSTSSARIDAGTPVWRLLYDTATQQFAEWQFVCPQEYSSNPYMRLLWGVGSGMAVARSVHWIVDQWGFAPYNALTYYANTHSQLNSSAVATSASYVAGTLQSTTVPFVNSVSLQAGNLIKIRISASGGYVGNAELIGLNFEYTRA